MKRQGICGKGNDVNMATRIRPVISEKNKYWVDKHRYYELKHFCLQYPTWKKLYLALDGFGKKSLDLTMFTSGNKPSDPTAKCAIAKSYYSERIAMVERAAVEADPALASYILKGITEELSYEYLKTKMYIPCSKDTYYDRYRRFFWILNKERQ